MGRGGGERFIGGKWRLSDPVKSSVRLCESVGFTLELKPVEDLEQS